MKLIIYLILILGSALNAPAQLFQPNQWCSNFPDVPGGVNALWGHAVGVIGDTVYVAGGNSDGTASTNFYKYSISGNVWSTGTSLPVARSGGDLTAVRGKLYYIGGGSSVSNATQDQYRYDPLNGTWSTIANIPNPVTGNVACTYKDSLIFCLLGGWSAYSAGVQIYNPKKY